MSENNILLIDTSPSTDFLTLDGELVWAVKNQSELEGLQKLAKIFGSTIKNVTGRTENLPLGKEEVIALGKDTREAGLLYAHLTRRKFRSVESIEEILNGRIPSILIIKPKSLNGELLEFFYKPKANVNTIPGIIFWENSQDGRRQVLIRSAAAHLGGQLESIRVDIHPLLDFGYKKSSQYEFLGGMASPSDMRASVGRGTGVLIMSTHSDGIDADMGKNLTLCPMNEIKTKPSLFFSPICQARRFCQRHNIAIEEFLQSDKVLSPGDIAARIFILNGCHVLSLQSGMVDIGWSLAQRLADCSLGAIVMTWETVITRPNQTAILGQNLSKGMPVGEAVALYNKSSEAKLFGKHRLCLLGDPKVKLPNIGLAKKDSSKIKSLRKERDKTDLTEVLGKNSPSRVEFFDIGFSYLAKRTVDEEKLSLISKTQTKIGKYRELARKNSSGSSIESRRNEMLEAILDYIIHISGDIQSMWIPLADKFTIRTLVEKCINCQQPISTTNIAIKLFKTFRRRLVICPNCGIIEDSPSSVKLKFSLDKQNLELWGKLPQQKCVAKVLVTSSSETDIREWEWDMNDSRKLKHSFKIPDITSPSYLLVFVIIVWSDNYVLLKKLTRLFQSDSDRR